MDPGVAANPDRANDEGVDNNEGIAARDGGDDVDPWLDYVMSEEDAAALHAMLRLPVQPCRNKLVPCA